MNNLVDENMSISEIRNIVSQRIYELINNNAVVSFNIEQLKKIHYYLFHGLYQNAGQLRKDNLFKKEKIIDDETILYVNYQDIENYLRYDLETEKNYNYQGKTTEEILKHFAKFTANIWQAHPFLDGNTRTVAVFMMIYFKQLGFQPDNEVLKSNFSYFRNALVLSNCLGENMLPPYQYLIKFYENVLFAQNNELDIKEMFEFNENERRKR